MKNKKALMILFIANAVSGFAQGLTMLSIPWYFKSSMDRYPLFMVAVVVITFGSLFWGLYSGTIVDGFNRKDVFLGTNFMGGLIVLSVASLGFREGELPISLILLVYTTTLYGYIIHFPNLYAFSQEVTDPKDYTRVVSYIEIVGQATAMASAALGGVLLGGVDLIQDIPLIGSVAIHFEKWSLHEIFLVDALAFFMSFGIVIFINYQPLKKDMTIDEGDLKDRLKIGYDYLKKNRLVSIFGICSYSIFVIVLVEIFVLLFLYVDNHLQEGADVLGISEMMFASGSLISGIVIRNLMSKMPIPKSIIVLTYLTTAAFFVVAFTSSVWVFYVFCFIIGFTNAGSRIFRVSYLFNLVPNELTGRVNSIFNVVTTMCRIIFIVVFLLPFFQEGSQITNAYIILGFFTLGCAILLTYLYKPLLKLTETISESSH